MKWQPPVNLSTETYRALVGKPVDERVAAKRLIPVGCWAISARSPFRHGRTLMHLYERAVTVTYGAATSRAAWTRCDYALMLPRFYLEPPDFADLCDACALADFTANPVVYRFEDATGRALYIGCTTNLLARLPAHSRREWVKSTAAVTYVEYPDLGSALSAEAAAIRDEQPPFNIRDKGGWLRTPRRHVRKERAS